MKILHVISSPDIGGAETFILGVSRYFASLGHGVTIVNLWGNSRMRPSAIESQIDYTEIGGSNRCIGLLDIRRVIKEVMETKVDIIIGYGIRTSLVLRLIKPIIGSTPLIIGLRGLDEWRRWYHILLDRYTEFAVDMFVANSEAVGRFRINRERTPSKKIVVIKNGIDIVWFDRSNCRGCRSHEFDLDPNRLTIAAVGNFRPQKGYDFLLDVIANYSNSLRKAQVILAGDGSLKADVEERSRSKAHGIPIRFPGRVKDIRELLACTDVFVLPSREEGMPRALMEAMAMGLPSVATNVGGVSEVLQDGISGLLTEFGDVHSFGNRLVQLIHNELLRKSMGLAARARICQEFSFEKIAQQYIALFELVKAGNRNAEQIQTMIGHV